MKIIELRSENFKRLVAVRIRPNSNLVEITGRNGHGKSSCLDSIYVALAGKAAAPAVPIRKGQERATIQLDLGEIVVTRTFKRGKEVGDYTTSLTVESADGARFSSPQTLLDDLLETLAFDPLAFARMDRKAQFDTLRSFVPGVDFEQIERDNKADYDRRTDVNRSAKEAQAAAEAIRLSEAPPATRVDEVALVHKLESAGEHNGTIERRRANREALRRQVESLAQQAHSYREQAAELRRQAEQLEAQAARCETESTDGQEKLDAAPPLPDPIDVSELASAINKASETNRAIDEWSADKRRRDELARAAEALTRESEEITNRMEERLQQKQSAIARARMPVDGLGFGDGFVTLNGVPFEQGSDAEQLRASVAIAAAMNPKLRVIRVRDGSLLDEDSMQLLAQLADRYDFQVWIERVDSSGKVGFVLEDGHLKQPAASESAA